MPELTALPSLRRNQSTFKNIQDTTLTFKDEEQRRFITYATHLMTETIVKTVI